MNRGNFILGCLRVREEDFCMAELINNFLDKRMDMNDMNGS